MWLTCQVYVCLSVCGACVHGGLEFEHLRASQSTTRILPSDVAVGYSEVRREIWCTSPPVPSSDVAALCAAGPDVTPRKVSLRDVFERWLSHSKVKRWLSHPLTRRPDTQNVHTAESVESCFGTFWDLARTVRYGGSEKDREIAMRNGHLWLKDPWRCIRPGCLMRQCVTLFDLNILQ